MRWQETEGPTNMASHDDAEPSAERGGVPKQVLHFFCFRCGKKLGARASLSGKEAACPACKSMLTVPKARQLVAPSSSSDQPGIGKHASCTPHSGVLILTMACQTKEKGGEAAYSPDGSLAEQVPERAAELFSRRKAILDFIRSGKRSRQGVPLREQPRNLHLKEGPDFGSLQTSPKEIEYLPAVCRYAGRFFSELGENREQLLRQSPHHCLILDGLYGMLTAVENLQLYDCYLLDDSSIAKTWRDNGFLDRLLVDYCRSSRIRRIFVLLPESAYSDLIDWDYVSKEVPSILHVHGEQNAGPGALPSLGSLARQYLMPASEESLMAM